MFWADKLVASIDRQLPQIVNDSKTPSGRAHVGALRGVIIHDAVFRVLQEQGFAARYTFGVDDYDPLDELPYLQDEQYRPFLGRPLCEVPPPPESTATDMADYYISEFFSVFAKLGVYPETYRMRDVYRSGQFDAIIDTILANAARVREIYLTVSGAQKPASWLPFQMICEQCGRIGTTEAYAYDGKEVSYHCRPKLVKWATGCGYEGKGSPFSGRGKLPWKLEWVAKWAARGVNVEGAGKDHNTKGGSRDVAVACLTSLFNKAAPLNIPYEFFLVGGGKMSSSRGIGVAARDMADFLPPEILRFLILRSPPNRPLNFSPSEEEITKLFNEFDRCRTKFAKDPSNDMSRVYRFSEVHANVDYEVPGFQLIQALIQLPHINVVEEVRRRSLNPLTDTDIERLQRRIEAARYWLANYADASERLELQATLPTAAGTLSATQKAFLHQLATTLVTAEWEGEALQSLIFAVAKTIPIEQPEAFKAIYTVLFARQQGPKAGPLFSYLERGFLLARFSEAAM